MAKSKSTWGTGYKHNYNSYPTRKKQQSGCYVATSVYGSYDCPEVWVLRRYRDQVLLKNVLGRLFVRVYYRISPTMVRCFGKRKWFNKAGRLMLSRKVDLLKSEGFKDTRYTDL